MRDTHIHEKSARRKIRVRLPTGNRLRRGSRAALRAELAAYERGIEKTLDPRDPRRSPTLPRIHWLEFISPEENV
jgi:hypothetical protein